MADESQPSAMFHNFNLPHGNNDSNEDGDDQQLSCLEARSSGDNSEGQQLANFEKGLSDDEGHQAAFERGFPGSRNKKTLQIKAKKSPRRSGDSDSGDPSPKTKKPRIKTIFGGGPATHSDEDADDEEVSPKTPGHGIGMRLSSLTLEQQELPDSASHKWPTDDGENLSMPRAGVETGFGLSDREESPIFFEHNEISVEGRYSIQVEDPALAYGLRQNIDRTVAPVTWVDVDQSGNYDPQAEAREKALKLSKAKAEKKNKGMSASLLHFYDSIFSTVTLKCANAST